MTCGIPTALIREILTAMAETQQLGGKVVLDLCSGFQSIRQAVLDAGARYVAVDLKGNRLKETAQPRRAAAVLCNAGYVLAVECELDDGTKCWTVPAGNRQDDDTSLHHTAFRALTRATGLELNEFQRRVAVGPELIALANTTYFAVALDPVLSQAELARSFARRREREKISRMAWIDKSTATKLQWKPEDRQMLDRIWGQPPHLCMRKQEGGGC